MKRILILVEGQTEERFVKDLLVPYFSSKEIALFPAIARTKNIKDGPNFKGGIVSYAKVKMDLRNLQKDSNAKMITTMLDLYAIPDDFPNFENLPKSNCYDKAKMLEQGLVDDIKDDRFKPYIQIHEFEALLFSSTQHIAITLGNTPKEIEMLKSISDNYPNPEEINEKPETCPSRRLLSIYPQYKKVLYGPTVLKRIGLDTIRVKCRHFNEWLLQIESI